QSRKGENYMLLQPVWSLNLVNDVFEPDTEEYYHHYKMVNIKDTDKVIEGLQLVFVELPKFKPDNHAERKMYNLWLRYLTEIDSETRRISPDLTSNVEVEEAIEQLHISTFSDAQLYFYDRFWDAVSVENTWIDIAKKSKETGYQSGMAKGLEKGMEKGMEKGRAEGRAEGKAEGLKEAAANMKRLGIFPEHIAQSTGIPVEEIKGL
ncbi:MAG: PD-(D/E)XK nuclease family transposase, partial [Bacteroidales bacterium]|nr:PD-(D/E)XK nuclease family transposase [Bacteroidales bacterium]